MPYWDWGQKDFEGAEIQPDFQGVLATVGVTYPAEVRAINMRLFKCSTVENETFTRSTVENLELI